MRVRRATADDAAAIGWLAAAAQHISAEQAEALRERRLDLDDPVVRVAFEPDGRVVGVVAAGAPGEVTALYVEPEAREQGHGSGLLATALDDLASLGYDDVSVAVPPEDSTARRFFESRGWLDAGSGRLRRSVAGFRRRWDLDPRGTGVADGAGLVPELDRLRDALLAQGWVAEQPEHHLLPHVRRLCDAQGWEVRRAEVDDAVLAIDVTVPKADWRLLRTAAYSLLGTFAEPATFVRQEERDGDGLTLVAATGVLEGDSSFAPHGHTVRIHVAPG